MTSSEDKLLPNLLGWLLLPVAVIYNGWIVSVCWRWFIVPTFHLPALTIAQAIGVGLTVGMMTGAYKVDAEKEKRSALMIVLTGLLMSTFLLGIGAVVHAFM